MNPKEDDEFARFRLNSKIERAHEVIRTYRDGIDHWRRKLDNYHHLLGRVAQRLDEPQIKEPE